MDRADERAVGVVADAADSFDLNGDGVFDFTDRIEAMNRYTAGEMDRATAVEIITATR